MGVNRRLSLQANRRASTRNHNKKFARNIFQLLKPKTNQQKKPQFPRDFTNILSQAVFIPPFARYELKMVSSELLNRRPLVMPIFFSRLDVAECIGLELWSTVHIKSVSLPSRTPTVPLHPARKTLCFALERSLAPAV